MTFFSHLNLNTPEKLVLFGISAVIGIGVIPVLLLVLTPIFLIKQAVKYLAKKYRPDLTEICSGYTKFLAVQDVYTRPKCSGTTCFILDEGVSIDMTKIETIANQVLSKKKFAKATQPLEEWMGFYFWKDNPRFNLNDHLILHEETITANEFRDYGENLIMKKPFTRNRPLWEMHLFKKYIPDNEIDSAIENHTRSAVILLLHHALVDWFSAMDVGHAIQKCQLASIISEGVRNTTSEDDSDDSSTSSPKKPASMNNNNSNMNVNEEENTKLISRSNSKQKQIEKLWFMTKTLFLGPSEAVYHTLLSYKNTLRNRTGIKPICEHHSFQMRVPIEAFREVAQKNGVRSIPLLMSGLCGALRQTLIEAGIKNLPDEISSTGPVPIPGKRPKDLNNYYTIMPIQLPVREEDPSKRLKSISQSFENIRHSTAPLVYFGMFEVIGSLFGWMVRLIAAFPLGAISHSVLPGPTDLKETLGFGVNKAVFSGAMPFGDVVMLGFFSVLTNGLLHIKVTGDKALFSTEAQSKRFLALVIKEIEGLNGGQPIPHYDL